MAVQEVYVSTLTVNIILFGSFLVLFGLTAMSATAMTTGETYPRASLVLVVGAFFAALFLFINNESHN